MKLIPYIVVWALLALFVLALALYRKFVSMVEDDLVHISESEAKLIPNQVTVAHRLEVVDRWGKFLTVVTVGFGLVLAGIYMYMMWPENW